MVGKGRLESGLRPIGIKPNPITAPFHLLAELNANRFLVRNLVRREVRGRYRNALLGYAWAFIEPALFALVYWFLFIMLSGNPDEMYAVWVLIGVVVWGCFGKALTGATNSLVGNVRTMHLVYFPRSIFPVSAVGSNLVVTLMSCLVVIPIIVIYDLPLTIHLIWIPVGVFLSALLALGVGMMFAPLNCAQRDVQHFMRFVTRAGFFVSPVMWTAEMAMERGAWGEAALWNPMVLPITMVRHGIEGKSVDLPFEIIASSLIITLVFYILGTIIFSKYERQAVKYL
jgi:ABC-type polysaccharide/polyol phosphate export permease